MLDGKCHCGNVRIQIPRPPAALILCNCSLCRRNGALWAFHDRGELRMAGHPEHTTGYVWGARAIETFRCTGCGCVTHWEPLALEDTKLGVNMRNFDPQELGTPRLRRFDGAETWAYLD